MTKTVLDFLAEDDDEINEFFLPKDGPSFCVGCNTCFMKGTLWGVLFFSN